MKKITFALAMLLGALALGTTLTSLGARASDHDDGTTDIKSQNTNLTDFYVFRKDRATGQAGDKDTLVAILNCNPRSLPRTNYYFAQNAKYKMHFSYVGTNGTAGAPSETIDETVDNLPVNNGNTLEDFVLSYTFGEPNATTGVQAMTIEAKRGTASLTVSNTVVTTMKNAADLTVGTNSGAASPITIDSANVNAFAGLRQDPFFFDVEQFMKIRGGAASSFNTPGKDFTENYNVLAIAVELPRTLIVGTGANANVNVFDTWSTIDVKSL